MISEKKIIKGLTEDEAKIRLAQYGQNTLMKKKKISPIKIFLEQFNDFIIWVLLGATIISAFMGEKADSITIIIIVVTNAILGFVQEYKTEKSLEALKELASPTAKVIRNNEVKVINAEFLVPGDLIILENGDRIPADCVLVEGNSIVVDESLLTGESVGVEKNIYGKKSGIYMGTILLKGKGIGRVTETGMNTEMGKIANMLDNIESEKSPLKKKLADLGKVLVILCGVVCLLVTVLGVLRGQDIYEMFLVGVSLAVAAIPEGMAAIVTVALALGVSRMLKRNALVRKLPAVETLGCTSVICSDKTGTLTQNNMTVEKMYFSDKLYDIRKGNNVSCEEIKKAFVYCNDCNYDFSQQNFQKSIVGDPTEAALIKAFFNESIELKKFLGKSRRLYDIPFDSSRKMMSVVVLEGNKKRCYVKGAPERIIDRCKFILIDGKVQPFTSNYRKHVEKQVEDMSFEALRCIAAAYKDNNLENDKLEQDLIFIGVAGMKDPPRKEVKEAVLKCRRAGIRPIMITGDHKNTAYAIGKELNICRDVSQVVTGEELDNLNDKELSRKLNTATIFARVSPKHKLRIVKAFKKKNNIVAMTGDGVNDAPAVKEADIGIAMGISGTDVTKEASSMILLDDNFSTIVAAVEEGRIIYDNIRKFIRYLLSCNLGEVVTMLLSSLLYLETPLLPIQILFVNLATDGLPAIALGVDPPDKDIMTQEPRKKDESIFARGLKEKIVIRGLLIGVCTVLAFLAGKHYGMDLQTSRTLALCTLIMSQLFHVFECRSEHYSIFEMKLFTNMYLFGAVLVSIVMLLIILYIPFFQGVFHTVPLNLAQWTIVIFFSGVIAFINSLYLFLKK